MSTRIRSSRAYLSTFYLIVYATKKFERDRKLDDQIVNQRDVWPTYLVETNDQNQ